MCIPGDDGDGCPLQESVRKGLVSLAKPVKETKISKKCKNDDEQQGKSTGTHLERVEKDIL